MEPLFAADSRRALIIEVFVHIRNDRFVEPMPPMPWLPCSAIATINSAALDYVDRDDGLVAYSKSTFGGLQSASPETPTATERCQR